MLQVINEALKMTSFIPHGFCIEWNSLLLWTLVGADTLIAISYFSIPFAIWFFARRRPDVRNRWLFTLFALFIVACGVTHLLDVVTIWRPDYWALALAKTVTAGLSFGTAIIIWRIMPVVLKTPSVQQLEKAKFDLEALNSDLEQRVQARTDALAHLNDRLETEKAQLRGLIDNIPDYIFIKDRNSAYMACNKAVEAYFGVPERDIIGKTDYDFVDADTAGRFQAGDQEVFATKRICRNEELIIHPDGQQYYLETLKIPYTGDNHKIKGLIGVGRNITERKLADKKLQLAAKVFSHAREGIMITDGNGVILEVNETFSHITGYSREEAIGQNPRLFKSGRQSPEFYAAMWRALLKQGHWQGEIWNRHKSGRVYAELITISAVLDDSGQIQNYVALFTDITQAKEHQQELEHIAHYDALTCLPNRVLLTDRLHQAMIHCDRRNEMLTLIYLDLDGFKLVNDSYGHQVGDELLIAISQAMKEVLREGDTLSRIGGDEFIAVLVDLVTPSECEPVLKRLLQVASNPYLINNLELQLSASIGVTHYPLDNVEADQLIRHADQAMYLSKQQGKNRYHVFDIYQDAAIRTQQSNLADIRLALDKQEFVLHYQPKVNIKNGEVVGVEALIRWQHAGRGLLPPSAFLPIIENHFLDILLGEWVIEAALEQIRQWLTVGLSIPVSVNISGKHFQQVDFVERIAAISSLRPDVQPGYLELEVLETGAIAELAAVSQKIKACRERGHRIALDDFGTGFSSLTYLRHLPVDTLKIDQSFVRDMLVDQDDLAIVKGVIGLAKNFSREVIAEGVETMEHAEMLLSIGCDLVQGYGIAKPMPAKDIPDWVKEWQRKKIWQTKPYSPIGQI